MEGDSGHRYMEASASSKSLGMLGYSDVNISDLFNGSNSSSSSNSSNRTLDGGGGGGGGSAGAGADLPADLNPSPGTVIIGIFMAAMILLTIFGNGLVITAVSTVHRLRSVTNYFVVSLAVADLTVAILVMPYSLIYEVVGQWQFGWVFCYFWISCDVTCCTASILHLCLISVDRYLAITQPLSYQTRMSSRKALWMIAGVWMCSVAISFVPIYLGWFADHDAMTLYEDSPECGLSVNKYYAVISSATSFYIPLFAMCFAYVKIFRIARRQALEIQKLEQSIVIRPYQKSDDADLGNHNSQCQDPYNRNSHQPQEKVHRKSKRLQRESKAITTLGTLMGLFCVSWLPFFLMYLIVPFCEDCPVPPQVVTFITWLGYANSCINPCVYAFLNRDFRVAFKRLLGCAPPNRGGMDADVHRRGPCHCCRRRSKQQSRVVRVRRTSADDDRGRGSDSVPLSNHDSDIHLKAYPSRRKSSDTISVSSGGRKYLVNPK